MRTISLEKFIFFLISFGFIFINILIAHVPGGTLSLIFVAVRDSWVILFIILLIMSKEYELILFIFSCFILGLIPLLFSNNTFNPLTFFYGFRDILLLSFIVYFIKNPFKIKKHKYNLLIFIIFGFSIIQLLSQFFGYLNILDFIFKTEQYYSNKGIISNTSGGFFGDRLTIPLYSSSLLGTFCAFYFFKTNFRGKFLSFIIGFFTLSKSIILIPIFHFLKKFYRLFIFCLFAVLFFVRNFIDYYIENNDAQY